MSVTAAPADDAVAATEDGMTGATAVAAAPAPAAMPAVSGSDYLDALAQYIKRHEAALASYNAPPKRPAPAAPPPSWTTVLTLGIVPTAAPLPNASSSSAAAASSSSSSRATRSGPRPRGRDPLVLRFDPHHLYYLLLKFDEIGLPTSGDLDVRVEGGTTRPMIVDHQHSDEARTTAPTHRAGGRGEGDGASLFGSVFGGRRDADTDARSVRSGMSSFSFGSGWWGLGTANGNGRVVDEAATVRYIYSSCTKLPALRLSPFQLSGPAPAPPPLLARVVEGFGDCPPRGTCVPLGAFKNLSALVLEDLDPRGFLGWDLLSIQLRSLEVHRGGIEDLGELICDAPCEDAARRERPDERRNKPVGTERRRRAEGTARSSLMLDPGVAQHPSSASSTPATPATAASSADSADESAEPAAPYPTPPRLAWSSLRHLSLSDNALTFIPSAPLTFLPSLTSLDLSSNLLITIPPALAHLTGLRSLDLSDNMIDSLLGIAKALGAVEALNLSRNRIENLSGLDRLPALERLDVRENAVYDVLEVSRLARLPHLREVWLAGNPMTAPHRDRDGGGGGRGDDKWRVKCLGYFAEEQALGYRDVDAGEVRIDGRIMTSSERRVIEAEYLSRQGRPLGLGRRQASVDNLRVRSAAAAASSSSFSSSSAAAALEGDARNGGERHAKVVGRRVVTAPHRHHPRAPSPPPRSPPSLPPPPAATGTESRSQLPSARSSPVKAKRRKPQRIVDLDEPPRGNRVAGALDDEGATDPNRKEPTLHSIEAALAPAPAATSSLRLAKSVARLGGQQPDERSQRRRERGVAAASSLDEPPPDSSSSEAGSGSGGEAFRRRIEALRSEVGESWLSVLSEREAREERERKEREAAKKATATAAAAAAVAAPSVPAVVEKQKKDDEADVEAGARADEGVERRKRDEPAATLPPSTDAAGFATPVEAPSPSTHSDPPPPHSVAAPTQEEEAITDTANQDLTEQAPTKPRPDNPEPGISSTPPAPAPTAAAAPTTEAGEMASAKVPTAGSTNVPTTTVKSVRKKRGKGKKKGGR